MNLQFWKYWRKRTIMKDKSTFRSLREMYLQKGSGIVRCARLFHMSINETVALLRKEGIKVYEPRKSILEYRKYREKYTLEHKEKMREYQKDYNSTHRKEAKEYRHQHREEIRDYERQRNKNPQIKLNRNVSSAINISLRGKKQGRHWENLVGYTLADLQTHLEKQFTSGISWDNYGQGWHIDHIIPVSAFLFNSPEDSDFKRCWSLNNLRPAWASYNMSKNDKLDFKLIREVIQSEAKRFKKQYIWDIRN